MADTHTEGLIQVKASAGSGKTYELTSRFLALMRASTESPSPIACAKGADTPGCYGWPEIMAVTFTNKAASEMKERVVAALKDRALSDARTGPAADWTKGEAALWLTRIIRRYHQLNIRTIDSLLNFIMRIFALEAGLTPDFETVFNVADFFDELYDEIALRAAAGGEHEAQLIETAFTSLLHMEDKPGFFLDKAFRQRLLQVLQFRLDDSGSSPGHAAGFEADPARIHAELITRCQAFNQAAEAMRAMITAKGYAANKRFLTYLDKCVALGAGDKLIKSAYALKPQLEDCLNKASKGDVTPQAEAAFDAFKRASEEYATLRPILTRARNLAGFIPISDLLLDALAQYQTSHGVLLNSLCPKLAAHMLSGGAGVPEAFCRMGARLTHMLIDEFQDTGRDQWDALIPLAEESLSKGGGVFYVGDVKQAIYGWRGGDARLFDEVADQPELARMGDSQKRMLPNNWRSLRRVVEFNNNTFGQMETPKMAERVARAMLGDAPETAVQDMAGDIMRAFEGTTQQVAPPNRDSEGFVRVHRVRGERKDDLMAAVQATLRELFTGPFAGRPPRDIAVLVRTNPEAAEVARWLIAWGWPVVTENSLNLAEHPVIKQLVSLLTFLDYPLDDLALWEFVSGQEIFGDATGIPHQTLVDWLATEAKSPAYPRFQDAFPQEYTEHIEKFFKHSGLMSPYDMASEIVKHFRILQRRPQDELFVRRFMEVIHAAEQSGRQSLSSFLEYWKDSSGEEKVPLPEHIDAVRIMTIHQSKGLEFPVVVVPFHHWRFAPGDEYAAHEVGGMRLLVPLCKELGATYYERATRTLLEQLNLLYVAWTRPVEELHCLLTSTPMYDSWPMVRALDALLGELLPAEDEDGCYEYGTRPAPASEVTQDDAQVPAPQAEPGPLVPDPSQPMDWLPRLKIHRHFAKDLSRDELLGTRPVFDQRMRGTLVHAALDALRPLPGGGLDTHTAARAAVNSHLEFLPPGEEQRALALAEVHDILTWAASLPEFPQWIARGRPECPILDAEGSEHRPDLLVLEDDSALVVEYKTGLPSPDHALQVRRYLRLLAEMDDAPARLTGKIIYLDGRTVEDVEP